MISLWIAIGTVEVCVLLFIVAAAVIAMAVRPGGKSPAETYFYAGELISGEETVAGLTITVNEDYRVTLVRHGLAGITGVDGAVSIAGHGDRHRHICRRTHNSRQDIVAGRKQT